MATTSDNRRLVRSLRPMKRPQEPRGAGPLGSGTGSLVWPRSPRSRVGWGALLAFATLGAKPSPAQVNQPRPAQQYVGEFVGDASISSTGLAYHLAVRGTSATLTMKLGNDNAKCFGSLRVVNNLPTFPSLRCSLVDTAGLPISPPLEMKDAFIFTDTLPYIKAAWLHRPGPTTEALLRTAYAGYDSVRLIDDAAEVFLIAYDGSVAEERGGSQPLPAQQPLPAPRYAIAPQFSSAAPFTEGLASVSFGRSLIDVNGIVVRSPKLPVGASSQASAFVDGLAHIHIGDFDTGKEVYVDRQGKVVLDVGAMYAEDFSEGLAAVCIGDRRVNKCGYIDRQGRMAIAPQFSRPGMRAALPFSQGLAAVWIGDTATGAFGFINKEGKTVISPRFKSVNNTGFSQGRAAVCLGKGTEFDCMDGTARWGFIDTTGKLVIGAHFGAARDFNEGLAAARLGGRETGRWGFIDTLGTLVIPPRFHEADAFSGGVAPVALQRRPLMVSRAGLLVVGDQEVKWGYIDPTGALRIAPQFAAAQSFSGGLAAVRAGSGAAAKWGYIRPPAALPNAPVTKAQPLELLDR